MTISALTYAEGNNVGQLAASVAASITAGNLKWHVMCAVAAPVT